VGARKGSADTVSLLSDHFLCDTRRAFQASIGSACALKVNGDFAQRSSTAEMIFGVPFLVSYISQFNDVAAGRRGQHRNARRRRPWNEARRSI